MTISIITAMDKNRVIGKNNSLPWYLPDDLNFFKKMTLNSSIVMGRKCFESIGKPLPNRKNIVLSRNSFKHKNIESYSSVEEIIEKYKDFYVIGGSQIYNAFLPYADKLIITKIEYEFEGNIFFPEINWNEWTLESSVEGKINEKNKYKHSFNIYRRKR